MSDDLTLALGEIEIIQNDTVPSGEIWAIDDSNKIVGKITNLAVDEDKQFDSIIHYLNYLAHEIDDIAAVAARLISERRAKYMFHFTQNQSFLREYAMTHLKRDSDGQIKTKNYKSITAGGGVFFRASKGKITITQENQRILKALLAPWIGNTELIVEKTVYEITGTDALLEEVNKLIQARAQLKLEELKRTVEMTDEQSKGALEDLVKQGESEIFGVGGIITVDESDPFHSMLVGNIKGWNGKDTKALLNKALDGKIVDTDDDVDSLVESLEE
jgi:hypothetical protein